MRVTEIGLVSSLTELERPLINIRVDCGVTGFPSPADDYIQERLDLNKRLIIHPAATLYVIADGDSMEGIGIYSGDIIIIDKSLEAYNNCLIVASLDGELIIKRYHNNKNRERIFLLSENPKYPPYEVLPEMDFSVFAVVTSSIRIHHAPLLRL